MSESILSDLLGLNAEVLTDTYYTVVDSMAEFLLMTWNILAVILIAWAVGKIIQLALGFSLRLVRFDALADKIGVGPLLRKIGVDNLPSYVIANTVYWIILFLGAIVSLSATQQTHLMSHLNEMLLFLPQILSVLLILVLTHFLAEFLNLSVRGVLRGIGVNQADRFGWIGFTLIWVSGLVTSILALGFDKYVPLLIGEVLLYAAAVTAAGFGVTAAYSAAREITYGFLVRARIKPGDEIIFDAIPGTVKSFSGLAVEIYQQGQIVLIPYSRLGTDTIRKKVIG